MLLFGNGSQDWLLTKRSKRDLSREDRLHPAGRRLRIQGREIRAVPGACSVPAFNGYGVRRVEVADLSRLLRLHRHLRQGILMISLGGLGQY